MKYVLIVLVTLVVFLSAVLVGKYRECLRYENAMRETVYVWQVKSVRDRLADFEIGEGIAVTNIKVIEDGTENTKSVLLSYEISNLSDVQVKKFMRIFQKHESIGPFIINGMMFMNSVDMRIDKDKGLYEVRVCVSR